MLIVNQLHVILLNVILLNIAVLSKFYKECNSDEYLSAVFEFKSPSADCCSSCCQSAECCAVYFYTQLIILSIIFALCYSELCHSDKCLSVAISWDSALSAFC